MKDKLANLDIKKGCQEADGTTALGYARSRHTSNIGDIDRAQHQREVVSAVGNKVVSPWTFINPFRYWQLNMAAPDSFAFGEGTSPIRAAHVGLGDDPRQRRERPDLRRPDRRPGRATGTRERSKQMFDYIKEDEHRRHPEERCAPRPACPRASPDDTA